MNDCGNGGVRFGDKQGSLANTRSINSYLGMGFKSQTVAVRPQVMFLLREANGDVSDGLLPVPAIDENGTWDMPRICREHSCDSVEDLE